MLALITAGYTVLYRFVPYETQAYLLWPFTALCLYSGAQLRVWQSLAIVFAVQFGTDVTFYFVNNWGFSKTTYVCFALFILLGIALRPMLKRHWLIGVAGVSCASVVAYALFFLVTNTAAWLGNARPYYDPHNFASLMRAYQEGLEFLRYRPGEVFGNPVCVGLVFGAHALLARVYFPAERFGMENAR